MTLGHLATQALGHLGTQVLGRHLSTQKFEARYLVESALPIIWHQGSN